MLQKHKRLALQVDVTGTPRQDNGSIFVQTVSDYPLVEAIHQNVVKHPVLPDAESRARLREETSALFTERYADYLQLGIEEWRKSYAEHQKVGKKAVLFLMVDDTRNCDDVGAYLEQICPELQGAVLVIHTKATEDHLRGYRGAQAGMAEQRVSRGLAIEHVMPRKWQRYWPLTQGVDERERESLIHTLGNLTLLTKKLNSQISNGPWPDDEEKGAGKRTGLKEHSVLKMSQDLIEQDHRPRDHWAEEDIRQRTATLVNMIRDIWPVPAGHRSPIDPQKRTGVRKKVQLEDLIAGGALGPGMTLFARRPRSGGCTATLLPDGQIDLDGVVHPSPSKAASAITGHPTNGWSFFLVDQASRRSLRTVRREYVDAMAADLDEDDDGDDGEDDDERQ